VNAESVDVLIAGGGIAGLSTSFELHRLGVSSIVVERAPRAGGVILSEEIDGYTIDAGPDSLLVQKPQGLELCEQLGLGDRLVPTKPPRLAFIQRNGRLHALPANSVLGVPTRIGPFIRTGLFTWPGKLRMGAEWLVPPRRDTSDESIGAFMRRRFGAEAATYLAEPLLAGIHAGDVDRLSVRALFPRFVEAEREYGSLLRAFSRRPATEHGRNGHGAFRSLPGGLSEMVRALVAALPAGAVRLNAAVTRIIGNGSNGPFRVETGALAFDARAIVLSTPAYVTARLIGDRDSELARLCGEIPYASTATITMAFRREALAHPLNGSGFVVPRVEGTGILAGSWLSSKWPHRAPDGRALLRTFVGGARDSAALERSDAELVTLSLAALRPLLGITGEPLLTRVYRFERANAQHEVGHLARLEAIERALERHPGLFVTGSGFRGVGIPDCIGDGRATARKISQWLQAHAAC
jgi:protoporphyrinogen/coproporphyrinogen III oxidase